MENTTPFDLEAAIQKWRDELVQSPAFKQENLNELESHLRDSISRLQATGLATDESFLIATRRVGHSGALAKEFGKLNRTVVWLQRVLWMLVGIQVWHVASGIAGFGRNALAISIQGAITELGMREMSIFMVVGSVVWFAVFAGTIWLCWWFLFKKGDAIAEWIGTRTNSAGKLMLCFVGSWLAWLVSAGINVGMFKLLVSAMPVQALAKYQLGGSVAQLLQAPLLLALTFYVANRRRVLRHD
jgi:hypothetical protein